MKKDSCPSVHDNGFMGVESGLRTTMHHRKPHVKSGSQLFGQATCVFLHVACSNPN